MNATSAGGRGLVDGDWVRQPLWIATAQCLVFNVALGLAAGLVANAAINATVVGCLLLAIHVGDPRRRAFRVALHAGYAASIASLAYSVFVVGLPGALILYYAPLLLIGAAHLLGAAAALFWSLPLFALVVASEFAVPALRLDPSPWQAVLNEGGLLATTLAFVVSLRRAYDRKALQLERLATTDALTGLANRHELQAALVHALGRAQRFGRRGALVFIDLDGLKRLNDRLGHDAGDCLLRELAERLRRLTRGVDVAARVGGDEFVVLLSEYDDPKGAEVFSRKLIAALRAPSHIAGEWVEPSVSVGVAEFPRVASAPDALLARADEAMYAAKNAGGARVYRATETGVAEVV